MMKKLLNSKILYILLGILIAGTFDIYASSVASGDVTYDNTESGSEAETEKDAIDDLYSKIISTGSSNIVYIGSTTGNTATFNIQSLYPDIYASLTTDNFFFGGSDSQSATYTSGSCPGNYASSRSYDPSTGILTVRGIRTNRQRGTSYCDYSLISLSVYMIY